MKGYKGFDKDLKCRGFQYNIGGEYEHKGMVSACESGFHFCQNPLDVFSYYTPADSRYCEVEGLGETDTDGSDSKVAASKLKAGIEIGIPGIIKAGVEYIKSRVDWENNKESNTGDRSAATNTGNRSAATNTGYGSAATNTGDGSAATNTGYGSAATNTGNGSAATNTGDGSAATNTGYRSAATNTGDGSAATNTGNRSAAGVEGIDSIACGLGRDNKAKGSLDCWLVLTEWKYDDDDYAWHIKEVKTAKVDGENIKADTWYKLINGEFVEESEDE